MKKTNSKKILSAVLISILCLSFLTGCGEDITASDIGENNNTSASVLNAERAEEIALAHAGVTAADAIALTTKTDNSDGVEVYEVVFFSGETEYDYEINAATGEILSIDTKNTNVTSAPDTSAPEATGITAEEAEKIALAHAGVTAAEVTFSRTETDYEDGIKVYEVEFYAGNKEYDYEINAATGAIISFDFDAESYKPNTSSPDTSSPETSSPEAAGITAEQAKEIAFNHAGVSAADVIFSRTETDYEDGIKVYEVEFYAGNKEYDYEINAATGAIISFDFDAESYKPDASSPETSSPEATGITAEKAKEIALNHAGVSAAEVTFSRTETDYEDGIKVYEIEFYVGRNEYDYEINAATGAIISFDFDAESYTPETSQEGAGSTYIGVDRAKTIAVTHAGVSSSSVIFVKAKLENDDGRYEYEIEFYYNGFEYEYSIDAISGTVLEYDVERDD